MGKTEQRSYSHKGAYDTLDYYNEYWGLLAALSSRVEDFSGVKDQFHCSQFPQECLFPQTPRLGFYHRERRTEIGE